MPDIFVPADTTYYSDYLSVLIRRNILLDYINSYSDLNRDKLSSKFPDFDTFSQYFVVEEKTLKNLYDYAAEKGIPYDSLGAAKSENQIAVNIKALIARTLFGMTGYYKVINSDGDQAFAKALEFISSGTL